MESYYDFTLLIKEAKKDLNKEDALIRQYLPFIKAETSKYIHRNPQEGIDDELSIAMFAFHEAIHKYQEGKGTFFVFASKLIYNRLVDFTRKEARHQNTISIYQQADHEEGRTLLDTIDEGKDQIEDEQMHKATKEEIVEFSEVLLEYDLNLTDIAKNCPKQKRTLEACNRALSYAKAHPEIFKVVVESKRLPIKQLMEGAKVEKKTLERHRKYIMAIFLAYTNGFEIIRGHLNQVHFMKGGK